MTNISEQYESAQLGDLCSVTTGDKDVNEGSNDGPYPFFTCAEQVYKFDSYSYNGEAILIAGNGNFSVKRYNGKFEAYQRTYVLQDFKINYFYLYYYIYHKLQDITRDNRGTTVRYIRIGNLYNYHINFPSLGEQNKIVELIEQLFSELDNAVENLKKSQEQLKIYRQAVLKYAFEGRLSATWRTSNQYTADYESKLKNKIVDFNKLKTGQDIPRRLPPLDHKDLFCLPKGWLWYEAHKICQSVRDGTHDTPKYVATGVPLITSKNLKNGIIDFDNVDFISASDHKEISKRSAVSAGDILYGMIGTIGNPVVIQSLRTEFSIKNVGLFKMNSELLLSLYMKHWLDSRIMMNILEEKDLIRGTTQKFISLGGLRVLPVPLPSIDEQKYIVQEIESRFSICENIEKTIEEGLQQAEALRQSILKHAFEGKLTEKWRKEHPELISGENSAKALLEKIKAEREALMPKRKRKS